MAEQRVYPTLAAAIASERKAKKLTRHQMLLEMCKEWNHGAPSNGCYKWETGESEPRPSSLRAIGATLKVSFTIMPNGTIICADVL